MQSQSQSQPRQPRPTKAIYQEDETLRTLSTEVTAVQPICEVDIADRGLFKIVPDDAYVVVTRETIFYAQGGGQPSDTGTMQDVGNSDDPATFEVSLVRKATDGRILHLGRFIPTGSHPFKADSAVHQAIDGTKRELNSRVHTAGHLVGLAVRALMMKSKSRPSTTTIDRTNGREEGEEGGIPQDLHELKAMHYPDSAFVEFRGSIEGKFKDVIQSQTDEFVRADLPVTVSWCRPEYLEQKCAVVPEALDIPDTGDGLVRVVDIEGAGAYPCGGTHVKHTGAVGKVTIRKISRQKGISKITYNTSELLL